MEEGEARSLARAIVDMREQTSYCSRCYNVTSGSEWLDLSGPAPDPDVVCVVERAQDIAVVERTREFRGRYHVLGALSLPSTG